MKRKTITTICLTLLMLCFCMSEVSAIENNRAVKGKTVFSLGPHTYISKIADGYAEAVAGDGTRFELKGEGLDGSYLFIIELLKGDDAYEWLDSELKSDGKMQRAYAVLLKNAAGEYVTPDKSFTVTIQVKASGENLKVWHVDPNENKTELELIEGDGLSVIGTKTDYYAVVSGEPANENPPEENPPVENPPNENPPVENPPEENVPSVNVSGSNVSKDDSETVKTGDNAGIFFWALLAIGGAVGCIAAVKNKRRNMYMWTGTHK